MTFHSGSKGIILRTPREFTAEYYERHSEPHRKTEPKQHAAHYRAIAQCFAKAAEEAEALAQEHRAMRSHGTMQ